MVGKIVPNLYLLSKTFSPIIKEKQNPCFVWTNSGFLHCAVKNPMHLAQGLIS